MFIPSIFIQRREACLRDWVSAIEKREEDLRKASFYYPVGEVDEQIDMMKEGQYYVLSTTSLELYTQDEDSQDASPLYHSYCYLDEIPEVEGSARDGTACTPQNPRPPLENGESFIFHEVLAEFSHWCGCKCMSEITM